MPSTQYTLFIILHCKQVFKENTPSQDWVKRFANRHGLTFRIADQLKTACSAITRLDVEYFTNLAEEVCVVCVRLKWFSTTQNKASQCFVL